MHIAVLMTCHNRKLVTLRTLAALQQQQTASGWEIDVYLVDDGSQDGTAHAVRTQHPDVQLLQGTGALFWNGGMRLAFQVASTQDYEFFLWLNDDTILFPDALDRLICTFEQIRHTEHRDSIIAGSTQDAQALAIASGGFRFRGARTLMRFELIEPQDHPLPCTTMSGNCVLIPQSIQQALGNLDPQFSHFLGDLDYGLRARAAGYSVWIVPGYIGTSPRHHGRGNELYASDKLLHLYQKLQHPKGLSFGDDLQKRFLPVREWTAFLRKHGGIFWFIPWCLTYRKFVRLLLGRIIWRVTAWGR
jgi:GT2 family glycosyltransferase